MPPMINDNIALPNGLRMPLLGLGTTHSGGYRHSAVVYALSHCGYRMIDTAKRYNVESPLSLAIRESGIARGSLFLTSKLWPTDYGFSNAQTEFKQSCKRLNVNYLDLYLLHFPDVPRWFDKPKSVVLEETWRAMERLYEDDLCRAIGVSNFGETDLEALLENCSIKPHVNQCEFHPYYNPKALRHYCSDENILFTGYCPLAKGTILDETPIVDIARKHNKSPAQVCIRWSIQNNVAAIPKSLKFERIKENTEIFDFELTSEDMLSLNNLHDERRKQIELNNLQDKFALNAGYKLNIVNNCSNNAAANINQDVTLYSPIQFQQPSQQLQLCSLPKNNIVCLDSSPKSSSLQRVQ